MVEPGAGKAFIAPVDSILQITPLFKTQMLSNPHSSEYSVEVRYMLCQGA